MVLLACHGRIPGVRRGAIFSAQRSLIGLGWLVGLGLSAYFSRTAPDRLFPAEDPPGEGQKFPLNAGSLIILWTSADACPSDHSQRWNSDVSP